MILLDSVTVIRNYEVSASPTCWRRDKPDSAAHREDAGVERPAPLMFSRGFSDTRVGKVATISQESRDFARLGYRHQERLRVVR